MPELAEVEYYRKQWDAGLRRAVTHVVLHAGKRLFRGVDEEALSLALARARSEIDAGAEEARRAAAEREALEALIADLNADMAAGDRAISALEADRAD